MNFRELAMFFVGFRLSNGGPEVRSAIRTLLDVWIVAFWAVAFCTVLTWGKRFSKRGGLCLLLSGSAFGGWLYACFVLEEQQLLLGQLVMVLLVCCTEYFYDTSSLPGGYVLPTTRADNKDHTTISVMASSTALSVPSTMLEAISGAINAAAGGTGPVDVTVPFSVSFPSYCSETRVYSFAGAPTTPPPSMRSFLWTRPMVRFLGQFVSSSLSLPSIDDESTSVPLVRTSPPRTEHDLEHQE